MSGGQKHVISGTWRTAAMCLSRYWRNAVICQEEVQCYRDIEIMAFYFLIERRFELRHQSKALRCFIPR